MPPVPKSAVFLLLTLGAPIHENDFSNASISIVRQAVHLLESLMGFG